MVELLLTCGANLDYPDPDDGGHTVLSALHFAADSDVPSSVEAMKLLLVSGLADVHHADVMGITALHRAVQVEMARLLLDAGADPAARDCEGISPIQSTPLVVSDFLQRCYQLGVASRRNRMSLLCCTMTEIQAVPWDLFAMIGAYMATFWQPFLC